MKLTADHFIEQMNAHQSDDELRKIQRYFKTGPGEYGEGDLFMGVRMGTVFELGKAFAAMDPVEIERLLESPVHEIRAGAVKIMAVQAANKRTTDERRKELFDLYLRRHDRINSWDLVDLGCNEVIGRYLFDKPRDLLYTLAKSSNLWERRTAIYSTFYFAKKGQLEDLLNIAELLIDDPEDMVQKPVGTMLRAVDGYDKTRLIAFLDRHAATMPRTTLRYAIEHFSPEERAQYLGLKKARR